MSDDRISTLERRVTTNEGRIGQLTEDIRGIRQTLRETATKADISSLRTHLDEMINGLLRDAIHAVPAKTAMIWACGGTAIMCIILIFSLVHGAR